MCGAKGYITREPLRRQGHQTDARNHFLNNNNNAALHGSTLPSASPSRRTTLHTSPPLRPVYNFSSSTSGLRNAQPPDGPACNRCYNFATTVSAGAAPSTPWQSFTTFVALIRDKCQYTLGAGDGWGKTRGDRWAELPREIFPTIKGKVSIFWTGGSDGWSVYRPQRIALLTDTRI